MSLFNVFGAYIALRCEGMSHKDAMRQAILDDNWAMGYIDSPSVVEAARRPVTFGSWRDAQI